MAILAQLVDGVVVNKFPLDKQTHSIGRHPDCDIAIDDISVSGNHAVIEARENEYFEGYYEFVIKDLGSTNGTFINDIKVEDERKLGSGDLVRIAWNNFKFIDEDEPQLDKTAQILEGSSRS